MYSDNRDIVTSQERFATTRGRYAGYRDDEEDIFIYVYTLYVQLINIVIHYIYIIYKNTVQINDK